MTWSKMDPEYRSSNTQEQHIVSHSKTILLNTPEYTLPNPQSAPSYRSELSAGPTPACFAPASQTDFGSRRGLQSRLGEVLEFPPQRAPGRRETSRPVRWPSAVA